MSLIFVNLKRFDVPRDLGGICPVDDPGEWIEYVIEQSVRLKLGSLDPSELQLIYLLPEALILPAVGRLRSYPEDERRTIEVGSQSVFREDVKPGGNFGAFTTNLPPAAARNMGCTWSIIGHSEERKDKLGLLEEFEPSVKDDPVLRARAQETVDRIINQEIQGALETGLDVLLCIGETAEERGEGSFSEQKPRIEMVLKRQLSTGLRDVSSRLLERTIVIGYEPIWAIGPGKTPPGQEYISYVSKYIKTAVAEEFGFEPGVVYGGGLKEENAGMIAAIETINGGLVALTRFTGQIGFYPEELKKIIEKYQQ
jgi:triosephosphate isomerase